MRSPTTSERGAKRSVGGAIALVALTWASGCLVTDAGIPSSALFLCSSTDQCPNGWTCDIAASTCVSPDAPRLDGDAVLSTTFAGPSRPIRVSFAFDRAIVEGETSVTLVDERQTASFPGTFTRVGGANETAFELLPIGVPDGLAYVDIRATSESTNATGRAVAGPIEIDATAPAIFEDGGQRSALVAPALASSASSVIVSFSANEPLAIDDPTRVPTFRVVRDSDGETEALTGTVTSGAEVRAELSPDPSRAEGAYTVFADSFHDRAWNAALLDDDDRARIGTFVIDATPPVVSFVSVEPETVTPVGDAHELTLCLSVDDAHPMEGPLDGPPEGRAFALTIAGVDVTATCVPSAAPCTHTCVVDATTDLASANTPDEGPVLLTLTATDRAGNVATTSTAVTWDERAPGVVNAFAWIEPGPNNVLFAPTALTDGSTLVIAFNTDEPVRGQPADPAEDDPRVEVTCAESVVVDAQRVPPFASTFFLYRARLQPGFVVEDGPCTVSVAAMDPVGNEGTRSLDELGPISIDRAAPDASLIDVESLIHFRAPWGMIVDELIAGAEIRHPFHTIVDESESALIGADVFDVPGEEIVLLRVFDAAVGEGSEIGRAARAVDDTGAPIDPPAFQLPELATRDAPVVWISVVDAAGNDSGRVRLNRGQWVSTTGSSATWDLEDNPMVLLSTPMMTPVLFPSTVTALRYPDPLLDVDAPDANTPEHVRAALLDVPGAATFERLRAPTDPMPFPVFDASVSADPLRGRVLLFGGVKAGELTNRLWELDGPRAIERCAGLFEACFWERPSPRAGAAMFFEPLTARTVVTGGCANKTGGLATGCAPTEETHTFDGTSFALLECGVADCAPLARHRHAAVSDGAGRVFVFGGCTDAACATPTRDVIVVEDGALTNLCDDGVVGCTNEPPARGDAGVFFHQEKLFVFGGCGAYDAVGVWNCTAPLGDLWSLDLATRTWTKHVTPGDPFTCAKGSVARVHDDALIGGAGASLFAACASETDAPRVVRVDVTVDPPSLTELTVAAAGDALDLDPSMTITVDPARERLVAVGATGATALFRPTAQVLYPARLIADVTVAPPFGDARAIFAAPSGEVVLAVVDGAARETWTFSGGQWTLRCTGCGPNGIVAATGIEAGPLAGGIVVGGNETWHFADDNSPDPWTNLGFSPPPVEGPVLVAQGGGGAILFGSTAGAHAAHRFDATGYAPLDTSALSMPPRFAAGATYSPSHGGVVTFGGCGALICAPLDDTHVFTTGGGAITATEIGGDPRPVARGAPILNREANRDRVVLFGGLAQVFAVDDGVHELSGTTWEVRAVVDPESDGAPQGYAVGSSAFDGRTGGIVFADGARNDGSASLWRYDGAPLSRPGHVVLTSLAAANVPAAASVDLVYVRFAGGGSSPAGDGALVVGWKGDHWATVGGGLGSALDPDVAVGLLGDDGDPLTDDLAVAPFVFDFARVLAFAIVPLPNADGVAHLTSTYSDVIVRYRLP